MAKCRVTTKVNRLSKFRGFPKKQKSTVSNKLGNRLFD